MKDIHWWPRGRVLPWFITAALLAAANDTSGAESVPANRVVEIAFTAALNSSVEGELELDVVFTTPSGRELRVPAFWAGGRTWKVRYASSQRGVHRYATEVAGGSDRGLQGIEGRVEVTPYRGDKPLYRHGPLRVSANRRHFEHADGSRFFWLGDTWWMGLSRRLTWPRDFRALAADRKRKGFTVIQIVGGLPPDMPPLDPRGAGDGGQAWTEDFRRIRPEFYNAADRRIEHLVQQGLVPCIVGAWKHYLPIIGPAKMKRHWRNLVARYGAWPVVWCVGGEINRTSFRPKYSGSFDPAMELSEEAFRAAWTETTRYLKRIDPFDRVVGAHNQRDYHVLDEPELLDMYFLQTGHSALGSLAAQIEWFGELSRAEHRAPLVMSEANYQWLFSEGSYDDQLQRHQFWATILEGGAGHTYGANGIWQVNQPDEPFGPSPHGFVWGNTPWTEAMKHPSSTQLGLAKRWLDNLPWDRLAPASGSVRFVLPKLTPIERSGAEWVWIPETAEGPCVIGTVMDLPTETTIRRGTLRLACRSRYGLAINGQSVHRRRRTLLDYADGQKHANAWTFPLAGEYLHPGRNVLLLTLEQEDVAEGTGLLAHLQVELADGEVVDVVSGLGWKWHRPEVGWPGNLLKLDPASWPETEIVQRDRPELASLEFRQLASYGPRCARGPRGQSLIYAPAAAELELSGLPTDEVFTMKRFNPRTGELWPKQRVRSDAYGRWRWTPPRQGGDWVLWVEPRPEP